MSKSHEGSPQPLTAVKSKPLSGLVHLPGDKSISHRAMIFGLLSVGETHVTGLLEGDDVLRTAEACRALGAKIDRIGDGVHDSQSFAWVFSVCSSSPKTRW